MAGDAKRAESDVSIRPARFPAAAIVEALRGRTVTDAYCDGEGHDDVHLLLDDGTAVSVDVDVDSERRRRGPRRWPPRSPRAAGGRGRAARAPKPLVGAEQKRPGNGRRVAAPP
jgi:hypothetical protein